PRDVPPFPTRRSSDLLRTEVGEEQAAHFLHRISRGGNRVTKSLVVRLEGLIEALAGAVEFPAMVRTSDAIVGGYAVRERSAAMRSEEHTSELQSRENL